MKEIEPLEYIVDSRTTCRWWIEDSILKFATSSTYSIEICGIVVDNVLYTRYITNLDVLRPDIKFWLINTGYELRMPTSLVNSILKEIDE